VRNCDPEHVNEPQRRPPRPAGGPRRLPRKELPSARQLDLRPTRILLRGLFARCPACGGRHIFHRWFWMERRCPTCTLLFERVEGHWIGSIGTNTVVVFGAMFAALLGTYLIAYPDPPGMWILWVGLGIAALGPVLFFPPSRMLWTAIDMLMRPLRPGEIDPRYVVNDPHRDRPQGP
jgi:uncharacterized protein (DUF983 family)